MEAKVSGLERGHGIHGAGSMAETVSAKGQMGRERKGDCSGGFDGCRHSGQTLC